MVLNRQSSGEVIELKDFTADLERQSCEPVELICFARDREERARAGNAQSLRTERRTSSPARSCTRSGKWFGPRMRTSPHINKKVQRSPRRRRLVTAGCGTPPPIKPVTGPTLQIIFLEQCAYVAFPGMPSSKDRVCVCVYCRYVCIYKNIYIYIYIYIHTYIHTYTHTHTVHVGYVDKALGRERSVSTTHRWRGVSLSGGCPEISSKGPSNFSPEHGRRHSGRSDLKRCLKQLTLNLIRPTPETLKPSIPPKKP